MPSFWRNFLCGPAQPAPSAPPAHWQNTDQYPDQPNQRNAPTAARSNAVAGARRPERMHDAVRTSRTATNTVHFEALLPDLVAQRSTNSYNNVIRGGCNARDRSGRTLAEVTLQSGRHDAAEIIFDLTNEGADLQLPDQDGNVLLHRLIMAGNGAAVNILLTHGLDPNVMNTRTLPTIARYARLPQISASMRTPDWHWDSGDRASALHLAAAFGNDPAIIHALVAAGANVHITNAHRHTALHWAASFCPDPRIIDALVACGANIAATTIAGNTPLHYAARYNPAPAVIGALIKHRANLDAINRTGYTALAEACKNPSQLAVVRALLHHGAIMTSLGDDQPSALKIATMTSLHIEVANLMRESGIDLRQNENFRDYAGYVDAGFRCNTEVMRVIIDALHQQQRPDGEVDVLLTFERLHISLLVMSSTVESMTARQSGGADLSRINAATSLTTAALEHRPRPPSRDTTAKIFGTWIDCYPNIGFARLMINRGGINARDVNGKTLVEAALDLNLINHPHQSHAANIVAWLIAANADLQLIDASQNHLVHRLILNHNHSGVRILLANRVDLNGMAQCTQQQIARYVTTMRAAGGTMPIDWRWDGSDGATPLHLAGAFSNDPTLIRAMITAGAAVDQRNEHQYTPLHWASTFAKDGRVIDELIGGGADIAAVARGQVTPIGRATASNPNPEIVRRLVAHGADIGCVGERGPTLLHCAAHSPSQAQVIHALIELGADPFARDENGELPLHIALGTSLQIELGKLMKDNGLDLASLGIDDAVIRALDAGYTDATAVMRALHASLENNVARSNATVTHVLEMLESMFAEGIAVFFSSEGDAANAVIRTQFTACTCRTLAVLREMQTALRRSNSSVGVHAPAPHSVAPAVVRHTPRATITDLDEIERIDHAFALALQREEEAQADRLAGGGVAVSGATAARVTLPSAPLAPSDMSGTLPASAFTTPPHRVRRPAIDPQHLALPLVQAVEQWYQSAQGNAESTEQAARVAVWQAIGAEDHAEAFRTFLLKLPETAEYVSDSCRPAFIQRIRQLLDVLQTTPALRTSAFELVFEAASSCGDRVALALNNIEIARINYHAEQGHTTAEELITLRTGMFRLRVLEELAHQKIAALRNQTEAILDEVEVVLGFQVLLAEEMDLPAVARSMRYQRSSNITPADLQHAREQVALREQRNEFVKFIAEWQPWQNQLRRLRPNDFADLDRRVTTERDRLAEQPGYTTDNDYVELCRQMETMQRTRQTFALENWTREWLVQNRSGAA